MLQFIDKSKGYSSREEWSDNGNGNFASVYFRIDTIGFDCMNGSFADSSDREAYLSEATAIIKSFGIVADCGYRQNNEYLHAHPQQISGIAQKSKIKAIAEAIDNSHTMKIRWTDVYEEYAFISDSDYQAILDTKRQEMAHEIIQNCFTKRTNLFKSAYEIAIDAMEKFKVNRINAREDINSPKATFHYAMDVIRQLVDKGYLIQVIDNDRQLIRSLNKTEQRKNKVNYEETLPC